MRGNAETGMLHLNGATERETVLCEVGSNPEISLLIYQTFAARKFQAC